MNIEEFREHCLSVKGAEESTPFLDRTVFVFKVMGKMFCYMPLEPKDGLFRAYMKCDPDRSAELREKYNGVNADMFKTLMWNWITLESDIPDVLIEELVRHSVDEVIKKLPKKKQEEYRNL